LPGPNTLLVVLSGRCIAVSGAGVALPRSGAARSRPGARSRVGRRVRGLARALRRSRGFGGSRGPRRLVVCGCLTGRGGRIGRLLTGRRGARRSRGGSALRRFRGRDRRAVVGVNRRRSGERCDYRDQAEKPAAEPPRSAPG
jgi:hypothetical protein